MRYGAVVPGALALGLLLGAAAQEKPKDIKGLMAITHKGKDSILEKVKGGKGSDADNKQLQEMYELLATFKAPQGDEKSWKDKTEALVAASKDLVGKKDGAVDKLKTASDCKACHSVHKPK